MDLRAVGELAHDVVQRVRRDRHRARCIHLGGYGLDRLHVEVGRLQRQHAGGLGSDQYIAEYRDGIALLHDARDMAKGAEQRIPVGNEAHGYGFPGSLFSLRLKAQHDL